MALIKNLTSYKPQLTQNTLIHMNSFMFSFSYSYAQDMLLKMQNTDLFLKQHATLQTHRCFVIFGKQNATKNTLSEGGLHWMYTFTKITTFKLHD